jgi:hypothetical protein
MLGIAGVESGDGTLVDDGASTEKLPESDDGSAIGSVIAFCGVGIDAAPCGALSSSPDPCDP